MATDTPKHIAAHKAHLFLSFGASLQFSGLGLPFPMDSCFRSRGVGNECRNNKFNSITWRSVIRCTRNLYKRDTSILYGTSSSNFALSTFNTGTGGFAYTAQNMDQAYVLDDRGIMSLGTTLNFGNFLPSSLTMNIRPFLEESSKP